LSFKLLGALNTSNNSNENTNYMNENGLVELISIEKKDWTKFDFDCGEWSKDIIELLGQNATYFLYKRTTLFLNYLLIFKNEYTKFNYRKFYEG